MKDKVLDLPDTPEENDYVIGKYNMNTKDTFLVFTNYGNYLHLPVFNIPDLIPNADCTPSIYAPFILYINKPFLRGKVYHIML